LAQSISGGREVDESAVGLDLLSQGSEGHHAQQGPGQFDGERKTA
jgi:hypothetical protein